MFVYHGTAASHYDSIIESGIFPRENEAGCWDKNASVPEHVYLTDCYAGYFAYNAASLLEEDVLMVVEVDLSLLDESRLFPDEDFIVYAAKDVPEGVDKHEWVKGHIHDYQEFWKESLSFLGNVAHRGTVPIDAVTRIARMSVKSAPEVVYGIIDAQVSPLNKKFVGDTHAAYTKYIMGDPVTSKDLFPVEHKMLVGLEKEGEEAFAQNLRDKFSAWDEVLRKSPSQVTVLR